MTGLSISETIGFQSFYKHLFVSTLSHLMATLTRKKYIAARRKRAAAPLLVSERSVAAERRFVASVVSVSVTPDVLARVDELTQRTRSAKQAAFLNQYRVVPA